MKKKKLNLPLIEVLVASLLLHIVAGVILGGLVLYQSLQDPEPEFVPPPEIKRVQPERLEYKVKMKQQQKQSAKPRMKRIQVQSPTNISVPQIDIVAPSVSSDVAVGTGMGGGSGSGSGIGAGGNIGLGKVSVDFFGIKNTGEKIFFIVDASKYMLEDHKGGYPAYEIVKAEIAHMVEKLPAGLLFNVALYSGHDVMLFKEKMSPKNAGSHQALAEWISPINSSAGRAGRIRDSQISLPTFAPLGDDVSHWARALMAAMSQGADAIFVIDGHWKHHRIEQTEEERARWLAQRGWGPERVAEYANLKQKARNWLANENSERRAKGQPERVVHSMAVILAEMGHEIMPSPKYEPSDLVDGLRLATDHYYKGKGLPKPAINVVLFLGPEEADTKKGKLFEDQFKMVSKRVGKRGRFKTLEGMAALQNVTSSRPQQVAGLD